MLSSLLLLHYSQFKVVVFNHVLEKSTYREMNLHYNMTRHMIYSHMIITWTLDGHVNISLQI